MNKKKEVKGEENKRQGGRHARQDNVRNQFFFPST